MNVLNRIELFSNEIEELAGYFQDVTILKMIANNLCDDYAILNTANGVILERDTGAEKAFFNILVPFDKLISILNEISL